MLLKFIFKIVLVKNIPIREIPSYFTFICNLEKILRNYHSINNKTMHVLLTKCQEHVFAAFSFVVNINESYFLFPRGHFCINICKHVYFFDNLEMFKENVDELIIWVKVRILPYQINLLYGYLSKRNIVV